MTSASPLRRLTVAAGLLFAVLVACGREITAPGPSPVGSVFRRVAPFAFAPQYETAVPAAALHAALTQVAFERVRITLRREDGSIALDTVVSFPVGADSLTLSLSVPLPATAPATGVPLSLNLGYVNAAGDTVFKGGPLPVTVVPGTGSGTPPAPVQVPVHYTGPGATASSVVITPKSYTGLVGQGVNFSAQAFSATGQVIAGTPIVFTSSNADVITINATTGVAALTGRGTAKIYAQLLTGPGDSATVSVSRPAARLALTSGGGQTAPAGSTLPQPVVARVTASDGVGVSGVTVGFAASGGGAATPTSAVTDAAGNVSTQWKLGTTAGAQTLTLTSAGLSGSPLDVGATAQAIVATKLTVVTGPAGGKAGAPLNAITVAAQDNNGNTITTFTGDVTVALGANPGSGTLGGTTTVAAVAGVATFSGLTINRPGVAYTLLFQSSGLSGTASGAFSIVAGDAATLVFGALPSAVDAGLAIAPAVTVSAQDAAGNPVTTFTGTVTLSLGANPGSATLNGTTSRTAVAGVATFDNLSITRRGVGYSLVASASGLAAATSSGFSVQAGTPAAIAVVSGAGQTAVRGSVLAPITVQLRDAFGNGITGATLALAIEMPVAALMDAPDSMATTSAPPMAQMASYGTLSASSVTTDASGNASFTWTLGNFTGSQRVSIALGTPALKTYVTATAIAGAAANLFISTPPGGMQTAGLVLMPGVVVHARDAGGALQGGFTGAVTASIASGPTGATLLGTTTVSAVAGVATFSTLRLRKTGAYTLTFSASGLMSTTTATFFVAAAPATTIAADSGNAQTGTAGTVLTQPLVLLVSDSIGNPVGGTSVSWAVAGGGGSLDSATTQSDANGRAHNRLTLGPAAGANSVTATVTGVAGSPVTFTANATASPATQLVLARGPRASSSAGQADTIIVQIKDAGGALVSSSTAAVSLSIASGPAAATIIGPTSVTAVGGIATFSNVAFDKMGTYTLAASSSGLTGAASTSFAITAGWPEFVAADSGQSQTGLALQSLPTPLVARITDQYGNKLVGRSIIWSVTSGGGSLAATTTVSDTGGRVRTSWTLGGTVGAQTVTATAADTGLTTSVATFAATASAVAYSKRWDGSYSTSWSDTANWTPSGVPSATDSVRIDSVPNMPVLSASATITRLSAPSGVTITLMGSAVSLTVNGSVSIGANSAMGGGGVLVLNGATGTIVGPSYPWVQVQGAYSLAGVTGFTSDVDVKAGGTFNTSGYGATIAGNLSVSGSGAISQNAGTVSVGGNASFAGTGTSTLTGGTLTVGGNFTASGTGGTVTMNPPHLTQFNGTSAQVLSLPTGSGVTFGNVELSGAGPKSLATGSQMLITGTASVLAGSGAFTGAARTALTGQGIIDATAGSWNVDSVYSGSASMTKLPPTLPALHFQISSGTVQLSADVSLPNANVVTYGTLDINGHTLTIGKNLQTTGSGLLRMQAPLSRVSVGQHATFQGGDESGQLTAGILDLAGNLTQGTNDKAFKAGPGHVSRLTGTANQTIAFAHPDTGSAPGCVSACFGQLLSTKTAGIVTFTSNVKADSAMLLTGMDSVLAPNLLLQARGDFSANGRVDGTVRARYVKYAGSLARTGGTFAIDTLIAFGAAAQLTVNETRPILLQGTAMLPSAMSTTVIVDGPNGLAQTAGTHTLDGLVTRNGGRITMTHAADTLVVRKDATFLGGVTTGLLTAGTLVAERNFTAVGAAFDASGSHATLMRSDSARVLQADPQGSSIGFQNLLFAGSGAKNVRYSGSYAINVKGNLVARAGSGLIGTDSAVSQVWLRPGSAVYDSSAATDAFRFARLYLSGTSALPKKLVVGDLMIQAGQKLFDSLYTTASVSVSGAGAMLDLNGHRLRLAGTTKGFLTELGGLLKMKNAADSLVLENGNHLTLNGGATDTTLTAGRIIATGNVKQTAGDPKAFAAGASHILSLTGSGQQLQFANPGASASHVGRLLISTGDTVYLASDVYAVTVETGTEFNQLLRTGIAGYPRLYTKGAELFNFTFDGIAWALGNGAAVTSLKNVSFINQDPAATQFKIERSGTGTSGSITPLQGTWLFGTAPSSGYYLDVVDTDGYPSDSLSVTFSGTVSPAAHGGKAKVAGTATSNWPFGLSLIAASSGDWNTASTWSPSYVPTANDDVTIGAAGYVSLSGTGYARHVTINSGGSLMMSGATMRVAGDLQGTGYLSGSGTVVITGTGTHALNISNVPALTVETGAVAQLAGNLSVSGNTAIVGRLLPNGKYLSVGGTLEVQAGGALQMTQAADSVSASSVIFGGVASGDSLLTNGTLVVSSNFTQSGGANSFAPSGSHVTVLNGAGFGPSALMAARTRASTEAGVLARRTASMTGTNTVQFASPGWTQSHFNILRFNHTNDADLVFGTSVYAALAQGIGYTSMTRTVRSDAGSRFYLKGANLKNLQFDGVAVQVEAGGALTQFDSLSFVNQDSTAAQLTLNLDANRTLSKFSFSTVPSGSGKYLVVNGTANNPVVTMDAPSPSSHGGFVSTSGGASISGWPSSVSFTASAGGDWQTPATWSPTGIPSRFDDVTVSYGTVSLSSESYVRHVTLAAGSTLDLKASHLHVLGNWLADPSAYVMATIDTARKTYHEGANTTIKGALRKAEITNSVTLAGSTTVGGELRVNGAAAALDVGSNTLTISGEFFTENGGVLKMGSGSSKMTVYQNAWFQGGATTGLLTNGTLTLHQNLTAIDQAFDASGNHVTEFSGSPGQDITWSGSGTKGQFNHLSFFNSGVKTINSDISVGGDITIGSSVGTSITAPSRSVYWSGAAMRDSSGASNGRWAPAVTALQGTVTSMPRVVSTFLKVSGTLTLGDSLRVNGAMDVSGTLNLNGRRLQASTFEVWGAGVVQMTNAADTLLVNGLASWHGASPNLTAGTTIFNGAFSQTPGNLGTAATFTPTGTHKSVFQRVSLIDSTMTFQNPGSSWFNDLVVNANIAVGSNVLVKRTLSRGTAANPWTLSNTSGYKVTSAGLYSDGMYQLIFKGTPVYLQDGSGSETLGISNVKFTDFSSFAGNIFEINRSSPALLSVSNVVFDTASITLSGGKYFKNTGTITVSGSISYLPTGSCTTPLASGGTCP